MKTYQIEVVETLSRKLPVIANSLDEAIEIIKEAYNEQEIVLDAEDFTGVDFNEFNENNK